MAENSITEYDLEDNQVHQLGGMAFTADELQRLKSMIIILITKHNLVKELQNNPEVAILFRMATIQLQQQILAEEKKKQIPSAKENPFWQYLLTNGFADKAFNLNPGIKAKLVSNWITTMAQQPHGIALSPELQRGAKKNARSLFKSRRSRLRGLILNAVWDNPCWGNVAEEMSIERPQLKDYFETACGTRQLKDWILFNVLHIVVDRSDQNDDKISAHLFGFVRATMVSCAGHLSKDSAKKSFSEIAKVEDKQDLDSELEENEVRLAAIPSARPALQPVPQRPPAPASGKQPTAALPKGLNRSQQESQARSIAHQIASLSGPVSHDSMWERFTAIERQHPLPVALGLPRTDISSAVLMAQPQTTEVCDEQAVSSSVSLSTRRRTTSTNKENMPEVTSDIISAANRANQLRKAKPTSEQTPSRPQRACASRKRKADEDPEPQGKKVNKARKTK